MYLEEVAQGVLAQVHPVAGAERTGITTIEEYLSRVVVTVADDVAAHG